jgi:hypothetical protein
LPFSIKCVGGPAPGVRITDDLEEYGLSWPLPERLVIPEHMDGHYQKVSESSLPAEAAKHPNVGVGAEYHWMED